MSWRCLRHSFSSARSCWARSEFGVQRKSLKPAPSPAAHHEKRAPEDAVLRCFSFRGMQRLLRRRLARMRDRIIVEHGRKPALGFRDRPALAARIVHHLVTLDLADAEIVALRVA